MTKKIALQLYSLRQEAAENFVKVLEDVANLGYSGVEFAGYGGLTSDQLKAKLQELGLTAVSSHVGYQILNDQLDEVIAYSKVLGNKYLVCPAPPRDKLKTADDWHKFGESLDAIGQRCRENGIRFGYHNHSWEFTEFDGKYALDILLEAADPQNLFAQLDLGWVFHAGVDPVAYLKKYAGRVPLVHVKDFLQGGKQVEVGTGDIDLAGIAEACDQAKVEWLIIETEEYSMAPIDSVRVGLENLQKVL